MSRKTGQEGEDLAAEYLKRFGYKILERNYRTKFGEIDIIAKCRKIYVFVEVKYRQDLGFGLPQEAVSTHKLEKIRKTAEIYLYEKRLTPDWRIDVLTIEPGTKNCQIFENVYTLGLG
jgi:putative endonuclease